MTVDPPARWRRTLHLAPTAAGFFAVAALGGWRVTLGASDADEGHVVAFALRLARGDEPLVDEMNLQVLGSLPAVPFIWLWDHVIGTEGIVLASRVLYVAVSIWCAAIAYRALRLRLSRSAALVGVSCGLLDIPYQLPLLSYSSVPVLALVLGSPPASL